MKRMTAITLTLAFSVVALVMAGTGLLGGKQIAYGAKANAKISPPGTIAFKCGNRLSTANGVFEEWSLTSVKIDKEHPENNVVEISIVIDSINSNLKMRDKDLKKEEFFYQEKYPTATVKIYNFNSNKKSGVSHKATMDLTIRGVKKTMPLEFNISATAPYKVTGKSTIKREDFDIGPSYSKWNPMSPQKVVSITFSATLPAELVQKTK